MSGRWGRLAAEEGLLVVITGFGNVANFVFHVFMSRMLGADGYGLLNALLSLLYVLSIPTMTIQAGLAQFVASRAAVGDLSGSWAVYRGGAVRVAALAAIAAGAIAAGAPALARFLHVDNVGLVWLLAALLGLTLWSPVVWAGLQGLRLFRVLGTALFVAMLLKCVFGIGLVAFGAGIRGAMWALIASTALGIGVGAYGMRRVWADAPGGGRSADFAAIGRYAVPVALGFLALSPFANFDIVLVRHYLPALDAGRYASTMILGKAFLFIPVGIVLALFPNVAQAVARAEDPRRYLWPALGLGAVLSGIGALICLGVPGVLAQVLVRSADPAIVPMIRIVGVAMTPAGLGTILLQYHMARKHWTCLPGLLLIAGAFVGTVVRWHPSPMFVLNVVGGFGSVAFLLMLVMVWWPYPRAAVAAA